MLHQTHPYLFPALLLSLGLTLVFTGPQNLKAAGNAAIPIVYNAEWDKFSKSDTESKTKIDYQILTDVLEESVFPMSPATKRLGWKNKTQRGIGTKLSVSVNTSPSRYEGNRLMIHAFSKAHTDFFLAFQDGLEKITTQRPLSSFNSDEQLAYWLNLHNVIVMNKIIKEYPIPKTDDFRKDQNSFWQEKVATVEGLPLSLEDIENIVISAWKNPLVTYGFWQGSVGGPSLPRQAFTGSNVWTLLKRNALEFVNSNRGVIPRDDHLEVSLFYEWTKSAYYNSDQAVLNHIKALGRPDFLGNIFGYNEISYKYYDWQVADLVGGNLSTGTKNAANIKSDLNMSFTGTNKGILESFPPHAQSLFIEMMKEDIPIAQGPTPLVTSEECAPDEPCEVGPEGS